MDNLKYNNKDQEEERKEKPAGDEPAGSQGRASFHTDSTTQGGSNHGQGSMHLSGNSYKQGDTANEGANYENERDKLNELNDDEPNPNKKNINTADKHE